MQIYVDINMKKNNGSSKMTLDAARKFLASVLYLDHVGNMYQDWER